MDDHRIGSWTCPRCGLHGQVRAGDPAGSSLASHERIAHPGLERPRGLWEHLDELDAES